MKKLLSILALAFLLAPSAFAKKDFDCSRFEIKDGLLLKDGKESNNLEGLMSCPVDKIKGGKEYQEYLSNSKNQKNNPPYSTKPYKKAKK